MIAKRVFSLGILIILSLACRTTASKESSRLKDGSVVNFKDMKAFSCEKGDAVYFIMQAVPDVKEADFDPIPGMDKRDFNSYVEAADEEYFLRLQICSLGDELIVKQIVKKTDRSNFYVVDVPAGTKFDGLAEAIFSEDYSKLNFEVPVKQVIWHGTPEETSDIIVVKGAKTKNAAIIYTASPHPKGRRVGSDIGRDIGITGKFEFQEPKSVDLVNLPPECKLNPADPDRPYAADAKFPHALIQGSIAYDSFKIDFVGFPPQGKILASAGEGEFSFSQLSSICKATITDSNKALGANAGKPLTFIVPFQGPEQAKQKEDDRILKYYQTHHLTNDALWLKSPYAVYGFGFPNDGDPFLPDPGAKFKVTYRN